MSSLTYAPLGDRTPFTGDTVYSDFTTDWRKMLLLLDRELQMLGAEHVVLEVDVEPSAIRLDGGLRADRRVNSPGVRLRFDSDHGPLSYATDRFVARGYSRSGPRDSWRHNVYAIAKGLEALRLVDRYGIAGHGEQYRGYLAIEARAMPSMSYEAALSTLRHWGCDDQEWPADPDQARRAFRRARAASHPDRHNGDRTAWEHVHTAGQLLGVYDGQHA